MKCHICKKPAYDNPISIPHESESRKHPRKTLNIYLCPEHLHRLLCVCIGYSDFEELNHLVEIIRNRDS
jgi:hypothetical protein